MRNFFITIFLILCFINVSYSQAVQPETVVQEPNKAGKTGEGGLSNLDHIADETAYKNASQFIKLKKYDKALQYLGEYLEVYSDGAYRKDALRDLAKIYYDRFDYTKAARYYQQIYEESNWTEEGIDGYYNAALCYLKMGNSKKAKEIFDAIKRDHPTSLAAKKARGQMDVDSIINEPVQKPEDPQEKEQKAVPVKQEAPQKSESSPTPKSEQNAPK